MMKLTTLLDEMNLGTSDLHLVAGQSPIFRENGALVRRDGEPLTSEAISGMVMPYLSPEMRQRYDAGHEALCSIRHGAGYYRLQVSRERGNCTAAIRVIPRKVHTLEELELPLVIQRICQAKRGIVIVTGPMGSGKSTTIAAMIEEINQTRAERILTIEDPLIYEFESKKSVITQQEVGSDVRDCVTALRAALNSDPDVVLIGELRDLETMSLALVLAETGHLVFTPMHCTTPSEAIHRISESFPESQRDAIRRQLASNLQAVVAQQLVPKIGGGRAVVNEILIATPSVREMIREGQTDFTGAVEAGRDAGMQTMDDALLQLASDGVISWELARERSQSPTRFRQE